MELFTRNGSRCHFNNPFDFGNHHFELRLDWGHIIKGEPMMDAEIWKLPKRKKNKLPYGKWHQTPKEFDAETGITIYKFTFKNFMLRLMTRKTVVKATSIDAILYKSWLQRLKSILVVLAKLKFWRK